MKSQSKLRNVSPQDQQYVLDLCQDRRYEDVVPILAQPRPVGLAIKTSVSALCRFYNQVNPLGLRADVTSQLADGLQLRQHLSGAAFDEAILTIVQVHLLDSLKNGKSIDELQSSFRILHNLQRNRLALARLRENDKDEIIAMHEHDEAILENEPDFTEIPSALPLPESAPNAPIKSELDAMALPAADTKPQPELRAEPANFPPNSTKNAPSFHLFHQISPAEKNENPPINCERPSNERRAA